MSIGVIPLLQQLFSRPESAPLPGCSDPSGPPRFIACRDFSFSGRRVLPIHGLPSCQSLEGRKRASGPNVESGPLLFFVLRYHCIPRPSLWPSSCPICLMSRSRPHAVAPRSALRSRPRASEREDFPLIPNRELVKLGNIGPSPNVPELGLRKQG